MTAFGRAEATTSSRRVTVELKAYNSRYLETDINLPPALGVLEPRIRSFIGERVTRGRVEVHLQIVELSDAIDVTVDLDAAGAYLRALRQLAEVVESGPVELDHLLAVAGLFRVQRDTDVEALWDDCTGPLEQAFADFDAARCREGEMTRADIERSLQRIDAAFADIERLAPTAGEKLRANLRAKISELLEQRVDDARLVSALAVVLSKADINEEQVRFRGHRTALGKAVEEAAPAKRMEFLCQELSREINTIAAKSPEYEIGAAAVEVKDSLERIREQLRNVE